MTKKIIFSLLITAVMLSCKKDEEAEEEFVDNYNRTELFTNLSTENITSALTELQSSADDLEQDIADFISDPTLSNLVSLQNSWKSVKVAWETYSLFNFGDPQDSFLHSRIDSWPTNTTGIESQVQSTSEVTHELVRVLGSNRIGLPALEFLLFLEGDSQAALDSFNVSANQTNRLAYLEGTGIELSDNVDDLVGEWGSYISTFNSSSQSGYIGSLSELVNAQVALLEEMIQSKIGKPSGISTGAVNVELAEAYRSETSLACLTANLTSLESSFNSSSGNSLYGYLNFLQEGNSLSTNIANQFEMCHNKMEEIDPSLEDAVSNDTAGVQELYDELKELLVLMKVDASNRLGVTITFNDNDGD